MAAIAFHGQMLTVQAGSDDGLEEVSIHSGLCAAALVLTAKSGAPQRTTVNGEFL